RLTAVTQRSGERPHGLERVEGGAAVLLELLLRLLAGGADLLERALSVLQLRFDDLPEVAETAAHALERALGLLGVGLEAGEVDGERVAHLLRRGAGVLHGRLEGGLELRIVADDFDEETLEDLSVVRSHALVLPSPSAGAELVDSEGC